MKKKLIVILLVTVTLVCSMASMVAAETKFERIDGTINYDAVKNITTDMTYRELAKTILENSSATFTSSPTYTLIKESYLVEFCNEKFKTEAYEDIVVEYDADDLDKHPEDYTDQEYKDWISVLDRKLDKDTIIKFGHDIVFDLSIEGCPVNETTTTACINSVKQDWKEYSDWSSAVSSDYKISVETHPRKMKLTEPIEISPAEMYVYFYVGEVADVVTPTETKQTGVPTGDYNGVAFFGIMGILALCGAGFVYKRREN